MKVTLVLAFLLVSSIYCCYQDHELKDGQCVPCPVGTISDNDDCWGCDPGFFVKAEVRQCTSCGVNRTSFKEGFCFICPEGATIDSNMVCVCPDNKCIDGLSSTTFCTECTAENKQYNPYMSYSSILLSGFGLMLSVILF